LGYNINIITMTALCDHDIESLAQELRQLGHNPAHAPMLLHRLFRDGGQIRIDELAVAKPLRSHLAQPNRVMRSRLLARTVAADGTVKLLVGFDDGAAVEAVLMPSHRPDRAAACVSSQVGCAMGCDFCASTKHGLTRNLFAGEIVEQYLHLHHEAK